MEDLGEFVIPEKLKLLPTDSEEVKARKRKKVHALKSAHRLKADQNEKQERPRRGISQQNVGQEDQGFLTGAVRRRACSVHPRSAWAL